MTLIKTFVSLLIAACLLIVITSAYTINEGESALILRLGKIVTTADDQPLVAHPGLHFRVPFIDTVRIFDTRVQELAASFSHPLTIMTKEQTYLVVEYFAKWRIQNLPRFYTSTGGNIQWAETLLEQRINDIVRAEYGKYSSAQAISYNRAGMVNAIKKQANLIGKDQGIDVMDIRIRQITLPKDVIDSVFKRMATERKQFAEGKRAEGIEKSEEIKALADQKVTVIKAQALMTAATIRAEGEKEAAGIYTAAYKIDPKFYAFYQSLEAYQQSFKHKSDLLILKPEGQFFNYFNHAQNLQNTISNRKK